MKAQTIFNKVVNHLRTQGKQAANKDGCLYFCDDGRRCAVGALIPKKYEKQVRAGLNGKTVSFLLAELPELSHSLVATDRDKDTAKYLLAELQSVHDGSRPFRSGTTTKKTEAELAEVAENFNLTYTPPSQ